MEVLAKETIKPASSTPHHLQKLNLSLLDQIAPPTYVHLIFFYQCSSSPDLHHSQLSQTLKNSLSHGLTTFYPLAGRIIPRDSCIYCNDHGVEYAEFRVHACVLDVVHNDPQPAELQKYVPVEPYGLLESHARGEVIPLSVQAPPHSEDIGKIVTKSFVCDKEVLSKLKKLGASAEVTNPTRIEAVTAFLWRNLMIGFRQDDERERKEIKFVAHHAVNVRSRVSPPLPPHSFGNGTVSATAWCSKKPENEHEHESYAVLVAKLRTTIRGINHEYVEKVLDGEHYGCMENPCGDQVDDDEGLEVCIFSSWCRFGVYEVDYGWGKPVWVSTVGVPFKNVTVFMDTRCGDGIEAWASVAEEDMHVIATNYKHLLTRTF
ncbi:UNVERIFIED_CONTAM: Stemmadenine O-acetyltransferase [Sesamum radiatum]|uniref:Stemmadenine O-acetyltransferase n=1 Tax=Sesamum radiatum TaxID=300843 RepID=A0AAW2PIK8_SESRA